MGMGQDHVSLCVVCFVFNMLCYMCDDLCE